MVTSHKTVAGRYVLLELLGQGGMGAVWRASDQVLKREIALKEVEVPPVIGDEAEHDIQERVLREARAAARLSHPAATTVYDVLEEDGRTYIAMELVDAPTLAELIEQHGPLEPDEVARIGLSLLDALDAAHAVGMVHRDVKPDNVMVTDTGTVKLTDFGIASVKGDPRLTMSGVILGSPSYMAPEQADGKHAGRETDLWALGATLFHAVEGVAPFKKDSPIATLASVVGDPTPATRRAGQLGGVIRALLDKDPSARPSSPDVRKALEHAARNESVTTQVVDPPLPTRSEPVSTPPPARRTSKAPLLVAGLLALLLAGAVAFALTGGEDNAREPRADRDRQRGNGQTDQGGGTAPAEGSEDEEAPPVAEQGWTEYPIHDTGYAISYPEGWEVSESGQAVRFSDPASATSFLVEYTTTPGDDAVAAWESQAESFAQKHPDYSEITIEPTEVQGFDTSAIWEFTYTDGGVPLHAIDIGMANDEIGFAHFFQTSADDWEAEQGTLETFRDSFRPL